MVAMRGNKSVANFVDKRTNKSWILDSGASDHMTGDASILSNYNTSTRNHTVKIADGTLSKVEGSGSVTINKDLTLKSVLYVPKLDCNLLSISKFTRDFHCITIFSPYLCVFQDLDSGKRIGSAEMRSGLYILRDETLSTSTTQKFSLFSLNNQSISHSNKNSDVMLWHYRLGHPNFLYLSKMFPSLFINKNPLSFDCEICQFAKHTRNSYSRLTYKPSKPFSLIHSDVWGPSRVNTLTEKRWFISFIDDHTRLTWVFLMKSKSEVSEIFQKFHCMINTQFQTQIQTLKTDNGKEFFNSTLGTYLIQHGIIHLSSCVDTPQQNGVAERKNRHLLEVARSLMFATHVPKIFWGDALLTAAYLINRMPSKVLKFQTPCQTLLQLFPHTRFISFIDPKVFGCTAFVHLHSQHLSKLDPKSVKCIFIGYSSHQKGYKCYSPATRKIYNSMDVTFFENYAFYKHEIQGENVSESHIWDTIPSIYIPPPSIVQTVNPQLIDPSTSQVIENQFENTSNPSMTNDPQQEPKELRVYQRRKNSDKEIKDSTHLEDHHESELDPHPPEIHSGLSNPSYDNLSHINDDSNVPIALRKGVRTCTKHPIGNFVSYKTLSPSYQAFVSVIDNIQIPRTIQEALIDPDWKKAVQDEINALVKNGTWTVTKLPTGKKPVGCKWIFTIKHKADGSIDRFKARLVAKGFTQSYGIDYQETFAPVAKLNTIRVLFSLAANRDWPLHQLDVKNAFLNGDLEEEVYMDIPPGFENSSNQNKACRLKKSLYGLKQSPRAWFGKFTKSIIQNGYTQCQADHTLFVKLSSDKRIAILIVYVDDIILTGNYKEELARLKSFLSEEFEIKDLGYLRYFLGMEIARSRHGIFVSQRKYVLDLLKETGMLGCKPASTPMDSNKKIDSEIDKTPVDRGRYQRLVGRLIYLSHTRPDIGFPVSVVSQYMNNPTEEHMKAVTRILRYLKMTPGKGLLFKKSDNREVKVYTDADWAGDVTDRRSTSGYCSYVWGNLVTWRSKKQSVVSRSSAEAEFRALALGICEGIWLKRLLGELGVFTEGSIQMFCDNQAAISIAKNPVHHDRTKHIEIDRHFITEKIENAIVQIIYTPSRFQTADILTKALPRTSFEELTCKLGMFDIHNPA